MKVPIMYMNDKLKSSKATNANLSPRKMLILYLNLQKNFNDRTH